MVFSTGPATTDHAGHWTQMWYQTCKSFAIIQLLRQSKRKAWKRRLTEAAARTPFLLSFPWDTPHSPSSPRTPPGGKDWDAPELHFLHPVPHHHHLCFLLLAEEQLGLSFSDTLYVPVNNEQQLKGHSWARQSLFNLHNKKLNSNHKYLSFLLVPI